MEKPREIRIRHLSTGNVSRRNVLKAGIALAATPIALTGITSLTGPTAASAQSLDVGIIDVEIDNDQVVEEEESGGIEVIETNGMGMPTKAFFPETGHHLSGEFLHHWLNNGDFTIYGFPITEPITENGRTVQYFERARLELWPEHAGTEWVIQGTLLGTWKADRIKSKPAFRPLPATEESTDERWVFPETRHSLKAGFLEYWLENGGVHVFGFPISEEFEERNDPPPAGDGETYTVQYFERARMEWHPENEGTPYIVLLGLLGHEYAEQNRVDRKPVKMDKDAVKFDAGVFSSRWSNAIRTHDGGWMGYVSTDALGIRLAPDSEADRSGVLYHGRPITIYGIVRGGEELGVDTWYDIGGGRYLSGAYVSALVAPPPPETFGGTWIDINLSHFWAIAYENSTPVYAATITAGRGDRTPKGVFNVTHRVYDEIMDSATVGFPEGHPEHYYLENVMFTQYFLAGGYALHGNYWVADANFGAFSSNGCVGLMNPDAEYFWNWLYVGSVVYIHF